MVSTAKIRANNKYKSKHYKQVNIAMSINDAKILDFYCKLHNISKAGFIRAAVWEKMEREEGIPALQEIEENTNTDQKED